MHSVHRWLAWCSCLVLYWSSVHTHPLFEPSLSTFCHYLPSPRSVFETLSLWYHLPRLRSLLMGLFPYGVAVFMAIQRQAARKCRSILQESAMTSSRHAGCIHLETAYDPVQHHVKTLAAPLVYIVRKRISSYVVTRRLYPGH